MKPNVDRWYYRCLDCLTVSAANEHLPAGWDRAQNRRVYPKCGACGGDIEEMGRVEGDRLAKPETHCACDARCTHATGPNCDCRCGGENHGTGAVVEVSRDCGPVPVLRNPSTIRAKAEAEEYRNALAAVWAQIERYNRLREQSPRGWLAEKDYSEHCRLCHLYHKARALRTHKNRMKVLRAAVPQPEPEAAPTALFGGAA